MHSLEGRAWRDAAIVQRLRDLLPPGPVLSYAALSDEVHLGALDGAPGLCLPRVAGDTLEAVKAGATLQRGALGVHEPDGVALDPAGVVAALVPGRAFSVAGARLGRGRGYYDRFLTEHPGPLRVGVAYEAQVEDGLVTEAHDVSMDVLVTEAATRWTGRRPERVLPNLATEARQVLLAVGSHRGRRPLVVLDVDSTLFSTGERHRAILVDVARELGDAALIALAERTPASAFRWSVDEPLRAAGWPSEALIAEVRTGWVRRFFAEPWCTLDQAMPGAKEAVTAFAAAGGLCVYLTARPRASMEHGTVTLLREAGFPLHEGSAMLVMKPHSAQSDADFKVEAVERITRLGPVVGAFDNEPGHVNAFVKAFPAARCVQVGDVHSPGAPLLDPRAHKMLAWSVA